MAVAKTQHLVLMLAISLQYCAMSTIANGIEGGVGQFGSCLSMAGDAVDECVRDGNGQSACVMRSQTMFVQCLQNFMGQDLELKDLDGPFRQCVHDYANRLLTGELPTWGRADSDERVQSAIGRVLEDLPRCVAEKSKEIQLDLFNAEAALGANAAAARDPARAAEIEGALISSQMEREAASMQEEELSQTIDKKSHPVEAGPPPQLRLVKPRHGEVFGTGQPVFFEVELDNWIRPKGKERIVLYRNERPAYNMPPHARSGTLRDTTPGQHNLEVLLTDEDGYELAASKIVRITVQ